MSVADFKLPPLVGYGTFFGIPGEVSSDEIQSCVEHAIDVGYRHIDTAYSYQTEEPVGKAVKAKIKAGVIKREDIFITSKLHHAYHAPEDVVFGVKESLKCLDLGHIDLYLIHLPFAVKRPDDIMDCFRKPMPFYEDTDHTTVWKILEGFVREGLLKSIGVSNFKVRQVQDILDMCTIKPVVNQCEMQLYHQNKELQAYCKERGVNMVAYGSLGQSMFGRSKDGASPLKDSLVLDIAKKYNKTPGQIALRFFVQQGVAVIPLSANPARRIENFQVEDFNITEEDMHKLESLDRKQRGYTFESFAAHKHFPFNEPF